MEPASDKWKYRRLSNSFVRDADILWKRRFQMTKCHERRATFRRPITTKLHAGNRHRAIVSKVTLRRLSAATLLSTVYRIVRIVRGPDKCTTRSHCAIFGWRFSRRRAGLKFTFTIVVGQMLALFDLQPEDTSRKIGVDYKVYGRFVTLLASRVFFTAIYLLKNGYRVIVGRYTYNYL